MFPMLLALLAGSAQAGEIGGARVFGLGVILGDPTGLSAKLYLNGTNALDFALAFDTYGPYDRGADGHFHVTYLWHPSVLASGSGVEVPWHVGVGGFVWTDRWRGAFDDDA